MKFQHKTRTSQAKVGTVDNLDKNEDPIQQQIQVLQQAQIKNEELQISDENQIENNIQCFENEEILDIEYIEEDDNVIEDKTETFSSRKNDIQLLNEKNNQNLQNDLSLKEKIINAQKQQILLNDDFNLKRQLFKSNINRENSLDKNKNIFIQKSFFNQKHLSQYQDDVSQNKQKISQFDNTSKSDIDFSQFAQSESVYYNESQISGLRHETDHIEPSFSIFAISGYCDKPLFSNEKITIKFSSLNHPSIYWNSSSKQNKNLDSQKNTFGQNHLGWENLSDLNIARTKFQAIVLPKLSKVKRNKDQMWILGGKNQQSQRIDSIEIYDAQQNIWVNNPLIKMRKAKSGFASVYFRNNQRSLEQLIIIGGNDGQVQNRVEFMNISDYQWHKCASMINRRDELAACIGPDNLIYAIGGYGGSTNSSCLSTVERYYPQENKWEQVASMNEGRRALAAVAMPDGIYAIGGYNGKDYIATVERYDILKDKWTIICNLNSAKCTMTAIPSPNFKTFYVIGGFNGTQLNHVEVFDSQTQQFKIFKYPMNQKRFMHASAVISD